MRSGILVLRPLAVGREGAEIGGWEALQRGASRICRNCFGN